MKPSNRWIALSLAVLTGCAVDPEQLDGDTDLPNAAVSQSLTSFSFDSTALAQRPAATLPSAVLTLGELKVENVSSKLLATSETPQPVDRATRLYKTSGWELETDETTGRVAAFSTKPSGPAVALDEATLQRESLNRLFAYGIGSGEIGRVLQRRAMIQDFDGTTPGKPELHSYKTFVFRGINGVPVAGHRAVISHALDGSVRKALLNWPALAQSGHALRSPLSTSQIEARAAEALARAGETTGKVSLYWQYLPVRTSTGEVTLKLAVAAHIDGAMDTDGTTEESRIIDVEVDAL